MPTWRLTDRLDGGMTGAAHIAAQVVPSGTGRFEMKPTRVAAVTAVLAVLLSSGACGGKDATGPGISLSLEEVFTLAGELGSVMNTYTALSVRSGLNAMLRSAPARGPAAATPISAKASCPGGGTTSLAGSYDGTTTVTANATVSYDGCKTAHFTTSGSFRADAGATSTATNAAAQGSVSGTLTVSTADGRSGACVIDLTINISMGQTGNPVTTISGRACGANVSGTY
jgi:hypothetical protein